MSVVQSINMPTPLCMVSEADAKLMHFISVRLRSSLLLNGLEISTTKHGGYKLYSLNTSIVLHTFVHDFPLDVHDGDTYPSTFLPMGFIFCGATIDGTVILWYVELGNWLQSLHHSREPTVGSKTVAMFEGFGLSAMQRLI